MLRKNDPQKQKILYTWKLYDDIINFQRVPWDGNVMRE